MASSVALGKISVTLLLVIVSCVVGPCGSVQWVSPGAADLLSEDRLVRVHGQNFCREEGRGSQVYVGAVDDGRCFLFIGEDDLQEAKKFKVLALSDDDESYHFRSASLRSDPSTPPPGAVPCSEEAYGCFLGASVYGDGLCAEGAGRVGWPRGRPLVYTLSGRRRRAPEVGRCPFVRYLIVQ